MTAPLTILLRGRQETERQAAVAVDEQVVPSGS